MDPVQYANGADNDDCDQNERKNTSRFTVFEDRYVSHGNPHFIETRIAFSKL